MADAFAQSDISAQELKNIFFPLHPVICKKCQKTQIKEEIKYK